MVQHVLCTAMNARKKEKTLQQSQHEIAVKTAIKNSSKRNPIDKSWITIALLFNSHVLVIEINNSWKRKKKTLQYDLNMK